MIDKELCIGCQACVVACPRNILDMQEDEEGFLYPVFRKPEECISCNKCIQVCPVVVSHKATEIKNTYAAYNYNYAERMNSSSGGIFYLLAKCIISDGGVVFGARFNEHFGVVHDWIDENSEIHLFQGSKYVQSNIGNALVDVKKFLQQGRKVLFSGTPCQIVALKTYLGNDYDNLYTQEVMCHGVPSPGVWREYLKYIQKKYKSKIMNVSFRNKENGWNEYQCVFSLENGKTYRTYHDKNFYMKGFIEGLYLRKACYDCKFKGNYHQGDLILADFWGVEKIEKGLNDNKGISLILCLSEKGNELFNKIADNMFFKEVPEKEALQYNPAFAHAVPQNINRRKFYCMLENSTIQSAIKRNVKKESTIICFKIWVYRIIKSLKKIQKRHISILWKTLY